MNSTTQYHPRTARRTLQLPDSGEEGDRDALAALLGRAALVGGDQGVAGEQLAHGAAQRAGALAVDDAHARAPGARGVVEEGFDRGQRLGDDLAADLDLLRGARRGRISENLAGLAFRRAVLTQRGLPMWPEGNGM